MEINKVVFGSDTIMDISDTTASEGDVLATKYFYTAAGVRTAGIAQALTIDSALSTTSENPVQNKVITQKVGLDSLNTVAQDLSGAVNEILGAIPSTAADIGAYALPTTGIPSSDLADTYAGSPSAGGIANKTASIPMGKLDATSTSTVMTATIDGITELRDGVCVWLTNGVVTSASGYTININGLGAKPVYSSQSAASRTTTIFASGHTALLIYNSTRVEGGCWDYVYGYDSNTNTIGYQLRTNSYSLPMTSIVYRYRLLFQSADNAHWVPANSSSSTKATSSKTVCQDKINPFGNIVYYGTTASVSAGSSPAVANLWQQYAFTFGYSFNRTGAALTLTAWKPIYIKCAPQSDGSAIIDSTTPYVQDLPTTEDGKIYIFLGVAYSETAVELTLNHPVYWYKDGRIRLYTDASSIDTSTFLTQTDEKVWFRVGNISDTQSEAGVIAALLDSSGNATTYNTVVAAYKKTRDIIIYYLAGISNQEIKSATIGRIVDFNDWSKQVTISWYDGINFGYIQFREGDVGTEHEGVLVQTDAHQIYIGDNDLDLTTFLTDSSYVRFIEIVDDNGNTYVYDSYYGNLDYSSFISASESSRGISISYGNYICFISSVDYYNQRIIISYIDTANGKKRLHELTFEEDNSGYLVKQSETITIIPTAANDVGAIAAPASPAEGQVLAYENGAWENEEPGYIVDSLSPNNFLITENNGTYHIAASPTDIYNALTRSRPVYFYMANGQALEYATITQANLSTGNFVLDAWSNYSHITLTFSPDGNGEYDGVLHVYTLDPSGKIDAPASPSTGNILKYNGSTWVAAEEAATGISIVTPSAGTDNITLNPYPVTYDFGERSALTVTVSSDTAYHFGFSCPSSAATTLNINGITRITGDSPHAGGLYEVDVWAGGALVMEVGVDKISAPASASDGQYLQYSSTASAWVAANIQAELPAVTSADNGKILQVTNGAWAAANLPIYNGGFT